MAKQFATRLALISFSTVVIRSVIQGTLFSSSIQTALVCLGFFYIVGLFLGHLAQQMIEEHTESEVAELLGELTTTEPAIN